MCAEKTKKSDAKTTTWTKSTVYKNNENSVRQKFGCEDYTLDQTRGVPEKHAFVSGRNGDTKVAIRTRKLCTAKLEIVYVRNGHAMTTNWTKQ